jgi:hypothetical protein
MGADLALGFAFNPAGQIASRTQSNDAYAWTGAQSIVRPYTTNGLNQYTATGPTGSSTTAMRWSRSTMPPGRRFAPTSTGPAPRFR